MGLLHPALISPDVLSSQEVGRGWKGGIDIVFVIANMENDIHVQEEDLQQSKNCIFLLIRLMSGL